MKMISTVMVTELRGQKYVCLSDYQELSGQNAKLREENKRLDTQLLMSLTDLKTKNLLIAFSSLDKDSKDLIFSSINLLKKITQKASTP